MLTKKVGAALLLAGTCIGAGMLALPVSLAPLGMLVSLISLAGAWIFMCYTGLLVAEVNICLPKHTGYISMAEKTLGKPGKWLAWIIFLLMLYSLMVAYITGGGALVTTAYEMAKHVTIKPWQAYLPWILIFAFIIYLGTNLTDFINRLLMAGLIISFALLAAAVTPHMHMQMAAQKTEWHYFLPMLPVLLASFGYHIIIPSVRDYLYQKPKSLRTVIFFGSLLPLLVYIAWVYLIFAVIPVNGEHGLLSVLKSGEPTNVLTVSLIKITHSQSLAAIARFFAFFAIASSFVGVSLGLFDLLADGLKVKRSHIGRGSVALLTFIPPLIFALTYPHGFMMALGYAGVFVAILHGILPAIMAWSSRYKINLSGDYRVIGGKVGLVIVCVISLIVIYAQLQYH